MTEQWPTDARFRRIAAKIADAVMQTNRFERLVSASGMGSYCPLGCIAPDALTVRPTRDEVFHMTELSLDEADEFMGAFDSGELPRETPFARLGLAYRARFP